MLILLTIENVIRWMYNHSNMGRHIQATLSDDEVAILDNFREEKGLQNVNSAVKYLINSLDVPKEDTPKLNPRPDDDKPQEKTEDSINRTNYDKWIEALNLKKL